jgi:hypothetical protein
MAAIMIVAGLGGGACLKVRSVVLIVFAGIGAWFIGCESGLAVEGMAPGGFILGASLSPVTLLAHLLIVWGV